MAGLASSLIGWQVLMPRFVQRTAESVSPSMTLSKKCLLTSEVLETWIWYMLQWSLNATLCTLTRLNLLKLADLSLVIFIQILIFVHLHGCQDVDLPASTKVRLEHQQLFLFLGYSLYSILWKTISQTWKNLLSFSIYPWFWCFFVLAVCVVTTWWRHIILTFINLALIITVNINEGICFETCGNSFK